jgi:REP element-mobilizing transposase RayT
MARQPRTELAGGIHHVFVRGAVRQTIYLDDLDRRGYLATLSRVARWMSWSCLSYCLMGNHMHLLIQTPQPNLGVGMQRLHGAFAQAFNRRHEKDGHVFGSRYKAKLVKTDAQLWATVRYIVQNPVVAGLCATPEGWPWSSHASVLDVGASPCLDRPRLLSYFASQGGDPRRRYLEYIEADVNADLRGLAL